MPKRLLQIDFSYMGPWGEEMRDAMKQTAEDIAKEEGLIWKIWTSDRATKRAGGIYLFKDQASLDHYLVKHTSRLAGFGITDICAKSFDIPEELTTITRGPV